MKNIHARMARTNFQLWQHRHRLTVPAFKTTATDVGAWLDQRDELIRELHRLEHLEAQLVTPQRSRPKYFFTSLLHVAMSAIRKARLQRAQKAQENNFPQINPDKHCLKGK